MSTRRLSDVRRRTGAKATVADDETNEDDNLDDWTELRLISASYSVISITHHTISATASNQEPFKNSELIIKIKMLFKNVN